MKKIILITLIVFLFIFPISLKSQWVQISSIGNNELRGVKFFNDHTGVVVGQGGVWKTTNSGVNWEQTITGGNFYALSFPDMNTGYVVGEGNIIHKTIDNAFSWQTQNSGTSNTLFSVSFFNASTGHAVGQNGVILRTINGGSIWYQNINQLSEDLNCVQMAVNGLTAFAVGGVSNELFTATGNGGTNWIYSLIIPNNNLQSLNYFPSLTGNLIAVGSNGRIRRTTNNGSTWTIITSPTSIRLNEVLFIDANTGYIVGNSGVILKSTNSGYNWVSQTSTTTNNLMSLSFINSTTGWAVGGNGTVLRTGIPIGISINNNEIPRAFKLYQNYPNPFNPKTKIRFDVSENTKVKITLISVLGSLIEELLNDYINTGSYYIEFDGSYYASGIYFYRIETNNYSDCKKMILMK